MIFEYRLATLRPATRAPRRELMRARKHLRKSRREVRDEHARVFVATLRAKKLQVLADEAQKLRIVHEKREATIAGYRKDCALYRQKIVALQGALDKQALEMRRLALGPNVVELARLEAEKRAWEAEAQRYREAAGQTRARVLALEHELSQFRTVSGVISRAEHDALLQTKQEEVTLWQERALSAGWVDFKAAENEYMSQLRKEHPELCEAEIQDLYDRTVRFRELEL